MGFNYNFMRFPGFRDRALTLSYDDGTVHDKRLAEIMRKNGVRGTFNLNSASFGKGRRMTLEEAKELFADDFFEVAVHGYVHYPLTSISKEDLGAATAEIAIDRFNLEREFGRMVRGMAYACGEYNDKIVDMLRMCGIVYSRTCIRTESFDIPTDWLRLPSTCHHECPRLMELAEEFLKPTDPDKYWRVEPKLFYLWGHSYEFADRDNWEVIERFLERVGNNDEVWYATNMQVYEYVKAYDNLIFSSDMSMVYNPSAIDVYIRFYKENVLVGAGKTAKITRRD
ncbi:MAG: polysaccharide deacetylase family protein [Clostridia bacterium]|nr:polysaccharide deacetylase family protein [Clostridia bacterium]